MARTAEKLEETKRQIEDMGGTAYAYSADFSDGDSIDEPPPSAKELGPFGDQFRPYRSVVARYCWEAVALFRGGTDPSLR